jgi:hypothetical protein
VEDAAEVNQEADVEANADSVEAMAAANGQSGATPDETVSAVDTSQASAAVEPSTSSKEPVSQHG